MANKYVMDIDVAGNAEAKLAGIASAMSKLSAQMEDMNKSAKRTADATDEIASSTKASAIGMIGEKIQSMGETFKHVSEEIIGEAKHLIHGVLDIASEFEDIRSNMEFAFGPRAQDMYDKTKEEAKHLVMTFKQASDTVAKLGAQGINAFGDMGDGIIKFKAKTGDMIGMLDVVQDTMMGLGLSMGEMPRMLKAVEHAAVGNFKTLNMLMPHERIAEMKKAMQSATGGLQEKTEAMMGVLAKFYGGASMMKANNYSYQIQQIVDKMEILKASIGGGSGLKMVTAGLKEFADALGGILENKKALDALTEGFKTFEWAIGKTISIGAGLIRWMTDLVAAYPWLPKVAAVLTIVATGFMAFASAAITAATALIGVATVIATVGEPLLALPVLIVAIIPLLIAATAAFGVLVVMVKTGAELITQHWGGVGNTFEKVNILFKAFTELFSSYNGDTAEMSAETADALQKMGLMDFVLGVVDAFDKLNDTWEGFQDGIDDLVDVLGPTFIPMLTEMGDLFWELTDALGITSAATRTSETSTQDWTDTGREMAKILGEIAKGVIWVTRVVVMVTRVFVILAEKSSVFGPLMSVIRAIGEGMEKIGKTAKALGLDFGMGDIMKGGTGKQGEHSFWGADAVMPKHGSFDPNMSMAGKRYRDAQGNFDPTLGHEEVKGDDGHVLQGTELLEYMRQNEGLNERELKRMARGYKKGPGHKDGTGIDDAYKQLPPGAGGLLANFGATNVGGKDVESGQFGNSPLAMPGNMKAVQEEARHREMMNALKAIEGGQKIVLEIDGKQLAVAAKKQNQGVAGKQ